ncbi:hypothetical protein Y032_0046g1331 [Ancylostoma ceylanicum]|uniref:Uncharacterized protein n=1 Tax=Ancylostoma ceylanicum TaxID=53326 RepID=A0A016UCQ5_9BILA|nr:hypothetical protein Y032_0046g1331 [Ancylostoma ceylanicum]
MNRKRSAPADFERGSLFDQKNNPRPLLSRRRDEQSARRPRRHLPSPRGPRHPAEPGSKLVSKGNSTELSQFTGNRLSSEDIFRDSCQCRKSPEVFSEQ